MSGVSKELNKSRVIKGRADLYQVNVLESFKCSLGSKCVT